MLTVSRANLNYFEDFLDIFSYWNFRSLQKPTEGSYQKNVNAQMKPLKKLFDLTHGCHRQILDVTDAVFN